MSTEGFERKLSAILSADVVGYSRLMGEDDEATVRTLTGHREMMSAIIRKHKGRVVDSPGDNLLAEFGSALQSVECAVEIQRELAERNGELAEDRRLVYRIGVNVGDVIKEGDRVYGDGVNIAARLESLAEPGGICISGIAYTHVKNKLKFDYEFLGNQTVKNISEPVPVYCVKSLPTASSRSGTAKETISDLSGKPSIAVLPFVNMSNDLEQEYFSDGITEELITALAKLGGLKVISRTSAFSFKGKDLDLRTIGTRLNVKNVLEGSVRKSGNRLRITVQLINVEDDTHVWAEKFDRELKDVFAIQEDITQAVVTRLRVQLLDQKNRMLFHGSIENQQSLDLYFKGLSCWNNRDPKRAIEYLEQSIGLDSRNALSHALVATIYTFMTLASPYPPKVSYGKAKAMAAKALEINDKLPDAHVAVGVVKMAYEYDWAGAEQALLRAIGLNPGLWTAHYYYAWYYFSLGRTDEAIVEIRRALELDPLSTSVISYMGLGLTVKGQYDRAIEYCQMALEITPDHPVATTTLGLAYAKKGMWEESIAILEKGAILFPENPFLVSALGYSYGIAGKRDEAQRIVNGFIEDFEKRYFSPMLISRVYAGMKEVDKAIEWLEKAYEERDPTFSFVKSAPSHDYMLTDPRLKAILKKMGLGD